jgi:NADH:ubiquinone oxidoreductase subunit 5 (subunit L)/multisubunit Na+/H+ antiporter MnhA subunit
MEFILKLFILIPGLGFMISLFLPEKKEGIISRSAFVTVGIHFSGFILFVFYWLFHKHPVLHVKEVVLFKSSHYEFYIDLFFDKITAVYFLVGAFLTLLVTTYSRTYLHREMGYKRFFCTILFFYVGYNLVILSGNIETLFIGWEILGITSFLLIAFYRNRYLPVKNAVKVFTIYRIGDVGLILAMWMSHHFWQENITFFKLSNYELVHTHLQQHTTIGVFFSLMVLLAAAAKSAQLPFSSWLPRAMEGPTPSSAIFYGSLAVHIGVFLLLRTYPFWEHQVSVRIGIAVVGLLTSIVTSFIARVQSSIKSQIAYSSSSQIGLIFIEVALGWENVALIHFAGNAFLRTYQLLVSPSVVSYLIREQFYNFTPRPLTLEDSFPRRIENSIYILSLKEWNLDSIMYQFVWNPLKSLGSAFGNLSINRVLMFFIPSYIVGIVGLLNKDLISEKIIHFFPILGCGIGLLMVLRAFTERRLARLSFLLIILSHFWIILGISFNEEFTMNEIILYMSGILISGAVGYLTLLKLIRQGEKIALDRFYGHSYNHPKSAFIFLLACLSIAGFPITPTFVGEDLIFTHIHHNQIILAGIISLSFIMVGFAIIRIFARVFLGPHAKSQHGMAYRSS